MLYILWVFAIIAGFAACYLVLISFIECCRGCSQYRKIEEKNNNSLIVNILFLLISYSYGGI